MCEWLSSKLRIFAGLVIWKNPTKREMQIKCNELRSGQICFGELVITKEEKPKTVKIVCEGKELEISRESAIALKLITD